MTRKNFLFDCRATQNRHTNANKMVEFITFMFAIRNIKNEIKGNDYNLLRLLLSTKNLSKIFLENQYSIAVDLITNQNKCCCRDATK